MKLTRAVLSIATTITLGTLAGVILWATSAAFGDGFYAIASGGVFATVAMLSLFSVSLQESARRLRKRGYARPVSGGNVVESAVRVFRSEAHPVKDWDAIPVKFDDGQVVAVPVRELYYLLVAESGHGTIMAWHRMRRKYSRQQWQAYRHLLITAEVVDVDGRGAMRLNCSPWAAIERVRNRQ